MLSSFYSLSFHGDDDGDDKCLTFKKDKTKESQHLSFRLLSIMGATACYTKPDSKLIFYQVCRAGQVRCWDTKRTAKSLSSGRAHTQERRALETTPQRRGTHRGFEHTWLSVHGRGVWCRPGGKQGWQVGRGWMVQGQMKGLDLILWTLEANGW